MDKSELISTYRLIAELFLYPEERDQDKVAAGMESLKHAPEARKPLEAFLAMPSAVSTEEYVSTLELSPLVALYVGSYMFEEPKSCRGAGMSGRNAYMVELGNIYRHFGFELSGREMTDFVPVVVEFLGLSLERSDLDTIGLRRYLIETQLLNGIEGLLSALRKAESPYEHLIDALRVALAVDIAAISDGPKWHPPQGDDRPEVVVRAHQAVADQNITSDYGVEL